METTKLERANMIQEQLKKLRTDKANLGYIKLASDANSHKAYLNNFNQTPMLIPVDIFRTLYEQMLGRIEAQIIELENEFAGL